jgi:hypothetical protein
MRPEASVAALVTGNAQVPGTAAPQAYWFDTLLEGQKQCAGKISPRGHDPRQIDLIAILALLILIVAACRFFSSSSDTPSTTVFIVPSQSVRW